MSSTMNTILQALSTELEQFDFATVRTGAFFDASHELPACLIMPRAEETKLNGPFIDRARYLVVLQMSFADREQDNLTDAAWQTVENILTHFSHHLIPSLTGHVDTAAELLDPPVPGKDGNCDLAAPSILLTFTILRQV